jgi:hypothetical protein
VPKATLALAGAGAAGVDAAAVVDSAAFALAAAATTMRGPSDAGAGIEAGPASPPQEARLHISKAIIADGGRMGLEGGDATGMLR